jgi:hypothetical protein
MNECSHLAQPETVSIAKDGLFGRLIDSLDLPDSDPDYDFDGIGSIAAAKLKY